MGLNRILCANNVVTVVVVAYTKILFLFLGRVVLKKVDCIESPRTIHYCTPSLPTADLTFPMGLGNFSII